MLLAGDDGDTVTYRHLAERLDSCRDPLIYLAIPPSLFRRVVDGLSRVGLNRAARTVLAPTGRDLRLFRSRFCTSDHEINNQVWASCSDVVALGRREPYEVDNTEQPQSKSSASASAFELGRTFNPHHRRHHKESYSCGQ